MNSRLNYLLVVICVIILGVSCHTNQKKRKGKSLTIPEPKFKKEAVLWLIKGSDTLKTLDIEMAESNLETQQGLMYRKSMNENQGMLFLFKEESIKTFYMKNTYIPLDILFFNSERKLVNIRKNAKVLDDKNISSISPSKYVLEIQAGLSDKWGVDQNTYILWKEVNDEKSL